ncbi:MAG: hypothetical protein ACYS8Z_27020, partial [Planctomycetota bacterium]
MMIANNLKSEEALPLKRRSRVECGLSSAVVIVLIWLFQPNASASVGRIPGGGLPVGFKILDSFEASSDQADAIGMRLGGKIDKLFNILISVHGSHLQVNTIACPNAAETQKIYTSILARKRHPAFCHTFDRTVVEFVGDDTAVAI